MECSQEEMDRDRVRLLQVKIIKTTVIKVSSTRYCVKTYNQGPKGVYLRLKLQSFNVNRNLKGMVYLRVELQGV